MTAHQSIIDVIDDIERTLRHLAERGCRGFECTPESLKVISRWGQSNTGTTETLSDIRNDMGDCRRCRLHEGRKHLVFGAGHSKARLVFVGEGPGFEEDQTGEPFVGAAGQLLTRIIEAIKMNREQVYICNIIKCRPPGNRNPMLDEIAACFPFLKRQLEAIKPDFICALGSFAARTLLSSNRPISKLRGDFHRYRGIKVLPTYHPAYLLRNPEKKRDVWEDMKHLMKAMERSGSIDE